MFTIISILSYVIAYFEAKAQKIKECVAPKSNNTLAGYE